MTGLISPEERRDLRRMLWPQLLLALALIPLAGVVVVSIEIGRWVGHLWHRVCQGCRRTVSRFEP